MRAPEEWQQSAIRAAYSSGDKEWILTAVFSMRWVRCFDDQILEALKSGDAEIQCEAIQAAGNWGLTAAWSHILALVRDATTPKSVLLAAIGAVASIRPAEARSVLVELADSDDEESQRPLTRPSRWLKRQTAKTTKRLEVVDELSDAMPYCSAHAHREWRCFVSPSRRRTIPQHQGIAGIAIQGSDRFSFGIADR